ncbi:hypothetical protein ACFV5N_16120 [Streptomyces sp. NPDC059853]|uniref:hypothetical protein n=1 Tax=Streptomyces sp. NPDC059853 TaxID=3346973 RepID=UPI00366A127E
MRGTTVLPVTAAAFLLALTTACGADGGSDSGTDAASATPGQETAAEADQEPAGESGTEEESAPEQPSVLALGESSGPVPFVVEHSDGERWEAEVEITVDRVELGEHSALEGYFDPEDVVGLRPAAVHVSVAHVSGEDLPYNYAGANLLVRTADGESSTNVLSVYPLAFEGRCPDDTGDAMEELPAGAVVEKCKTVLVPEDSDPAEVEIYLGVGNIYRADDGNLRWDLGSAA